MKKNVVSLSTDKTCAPIHLNVAIKLISNNFFLAAHNIKGNIDIKFSVFGFVNVIVSNGSLINRFKEQIEKGGSKTLTHPILHVTL